MGCNQVKIHQSALDSSQLNNVENKSESSTVVPTVSFDLSPLDNEAFSPTVCQQRQKAIDNMAYRKAIDQWRPSSIEQIINQNIRYDTEAYFNRQVGIQNPDNTFRTGKAVSEGYSSLYAELCNRIGLKCRKVSGYAKGFGFDIHQKKFNKTNHAWNIITLENNH